MHHTSSNGDNVKDHPSFLGHCGQLDHLACQGQLCHLERERVRERRGTMLL